MVMNDTYLNQKFNIYCGDSKDLVKEIELVHCVVTSPPYFQKRQYGESEKEIGNEDNINFYVNALCDLFDSINLHPQGNIWVNIGDKRNKDGGLLMVPEQFALAMIARKWRLVDNVIWAKVFDEVNGETEGHCMIEPATKRLNGNGWEYFYRFTKSKDAYCDHCAVRIPRHGGEHIRYMPKELMELETSTDGRVAHNVWKVHMGQTSKKHYAVFPTQLCERPIAMTCPMRVKANGDPIERIVEMVEYDEGRNAKRVFGKYKSLGNEYDEEQSKAITGRVDSGKQYIPRKPATKGWTKADDYAAGIVLDPFCGTGTTGEVALKLGRSFIGIDLYEEFQKIAYDRCKDVFTNLNKQKLNPWELEK